MIIAPFAERVSQAMREWPDTGIFGSFRKTPAGPKPNDDATDALVKLRKPFTLWRRMNLPGHHVQIGLWGKAGRIRRAILAAQKHGYSLGDNCQGGGYALTMEAIQRMNAAGYLDRPLDWLHTPCGEDVVVTLYVQAVGLEARDLNDDGDPFGVKYLGLPDTPENLLHRGFGVIHSVKDYGPYREEETRAFFREQREKDRATQEMEAG